MNYNPHVPVLAADGTFLPDGRLVPLPPVPQVLLGGFRQGVLDFLVRERAIAFIVIMSNRGTAST